MAPPTPLKIATSSINRLIKEEASYHKELSSQEQRIKRLEEQVEEAAAAANNGGQAWDEISGNREFELRQEKKALQETLAVFHPLHDRIAAAIAKIEDLLADDDDDNITATTTTTTNNSNEAGEVQDAKVAVRKGKEILGNGAG